MAPPDDPQGAADDGSDAAPTGGRSRSAERSVLEGQAPALWGVASPDGLKGSPSDSDDLLDWYCRAAKRLDAS